MDKGIIFESSTKLEKPIHTAANESFGTLDEYVERIESSNMDSTPIHVDEIASGLARIYEKVRKIVDWQEDNVLRRGAIERILNRLLITKVSGLSVYKKTDAEKLAETVTMELIRGGHLPNNEIPREVLPVVSKALGKYLFFLAQSPRSFSSIKNIKKQINFTTFVIETAACEIEEILANPIKEYALLDSMTNEMDDRIKIVPSDALPADEKRRQTFIAACRTLYDLDDAFIAYRLLDFKYPDWRNPSQDILPQRFAQVVSFWQDAAELLDHPLGKDFRRVCDQNDTVFALLGDFLEVLKDKPREIVPIIEDRKKFITEIGKAYDARYKSLKRRLIRLGVFSTLSVFISNWFTFYVLEVPMARLFYERFNLLTAFIDFLIPTVVMFLFVIIIRPPSKTNRARVLDIIESYVYKEGKKKLYVIHTKKRSNVVFKAFFTSLYLFMIFLVFTLVGATFYYAGLPITSVAFDTFTIALTVFAAVVIRNKSKELNVDDKTSLFEFALDMISVPMANVGSLFAAKWKEYNVIAIFLNFVVETPFAVILDTVEGWSQYLKDRKAELR